MVRRRCGRLEAPLVELGRGLGVAVEADAAARQGVTHRRCHVELQAVIDPQAEVVGGGLDLHAVVLVLRPFAAAEGRGGGQQLCRTVEIQAPEVGRNTADPVDAQAQGIVAFALALPGHQKIVGVGIRRVPRLESHHVAHIVVVAFEAHLPLDPGAVSREVRVDHRRLVVGRLVDPGAVSREVPRRRREIGAGKGLDGPVLEID